MGSIHRPAGCSSSTRHPLFVISAVVLTLLTTFQTTSTAVVVTTAATMESRDRRVSAGNANVTMTTQSVADDANNGSNHCPRPCDCYNLADTIDCSQRGLLQVPLRLPPTVRRLYLEDNRIDTLPPEAFGDSPLLAQVVLERNRLSEISTTSLCGLPGLQELTLASNRIRQFVVNREAGEQVHYSTGSSLCRLTAVSSLRELDLSLNLLTNVPRDLVLFAPHLEILDLSCNEISSAALDSSFSMLRSLRQLDLSRNRIHHLAADDFRPLAGIGLDVLNLGECELIAVDDATFDPIVGSLTCLSLAGNPLSASTLERLMTRLGTVTPASAAVPSVVIKPSSPPAHSEIWQQETLVTMVTTPSSFIPHENSTSVTATSGRHVTTAASPATAAAVVDDAARDNDHTFDRSSTKNLSTSQLTTAVAATEDSHISAVISVDLDDQVNASTSGDVIRWCPPLTRLDISQMKIDNLTVAMLGRLRRLLVVDAGFSDVKWVEPEVFGRLPEVETLHLESGRLTRLDGLTSLKRLRRLYVQENRLEEIIPLDGLYALVSVDLSYNRIKTVPAYWLNGLRNLQVLNLSHNLLKEIEPNAFHQAAIFSTLDLSFNRLTIIHGYGIVRLLRLDASHNFINSIDTTSFVGLHQTFQELDLSHNNITSFFAARLFHQTNNLLRLNLGHNPLGRFFRSAALRRPGLATGSSPPEVPDAGNDHPEDYDDDADITDGSLMTSPEWAWPDDVDNPLAHLTSLAVLDLTSAEISHLGCDAIASLRGLVELSLSTNEIARLDDVSIGCAGVRLARLIVAGNQLTDLDPECLSGLLGLVELDAAGNPFVCGGGGGANVGVVTNGDKDGDIGCPDPGSQRSEFIRWLNTTAGRRVNVVAREMPDAFRCHDRIRESYILDAALMSRECPDSITSAVKVGDNDAMSLSPSTSWVDSAVERHRRTAVFIGATVLSTILTLLLLLPIVICLVIKYGGSGGFSRSAFGYQLKPMSFVVNEDDASHRKLQRVASVLGRLARLVRCRRRRSNVRYREVSGDFDVVVSAAINEGATIDAACDATVESTSNWCERDLNTAA